MNTADFMLNAFCGFSAVATSTLFFSYHRKLFIRVFVPREECREAIRTLPKNPDFRRGMHVIAVLQYSVAALFGILKLWLALA